MEDGLQCVDIARVSRECAKLGYFCQSTGPRDYIVRRLRRVVTESVGPYTKSAECVAAVRALACISVYPECLPESHLVVENIPNFSKTLANIGQACDVSADALSERLLKELKLEMHEDRVLRNESLASMDVLVFAAFVLAVWCMGWYMVRQWSHAMRDVFTDPPHILSEHCPVAIQMADNKC